MYYAPQITSHGACSNANISPNTDVAVDVAVAALVALDVSIVHVWWSTAVKTSCIIQSCRPDVVLSSDTIPGNSNKKLAHSEAAVVEIQL